MAIESSSPSTMSGPPTVAPLPFELPKLKPVRRITGIVHSAEDEDESSVSSSEDNDCNNHKALEYSSVPPSLKRRDSFSGNILLPTTTTTTQSGDETKHENSTAGADDTKAKAYWIQRKIRQTSFGSVRIGFVVEPCDKDKKMLGGDAIEWKVVRSSSSSSSPNQKPSSCKPISYSKYPNGGYQMVAIKMLDKTKALQSNKVIAELSALDMITKHCCNNDMDKNGHIMTAQDIFEDARHIYIITPYYGEGSLFQYVQEFGRLDEEVARYFFRQILKALQTLQQVGLCHRGLSMHNVLLSGTDCVLTHLSTSLRVPSTAVDENQDGPLSSPLLEPQILVAGSDPQFMAPEILRTDPFDGYAIDLWASGLLLFAMLFGNVAPFVWAAPDDRRFRTICVNGNLESVAAQIEAEDIRQQQKCYPNKPLSKKKKEHHISEEALDLLQNILRADPQKRLTLQQVLEHPWVVVDETLASQKEDNVPPLPPLSVSSPLQHML